MYTATRATNIIPFDSTVRTTTKMTSTMPMPMPITRRKKQKRGFRFNQRYCIVVGVSLLFIYVILVYHIIKNNNNASSLLRRTRFTTKNYDGGRSSVTTTMLSASSSSSSSSQNKILLFPPIKKAAVVNTIKLNNNTLLLRLPQLQSKLPIINVGFPKAGTSTIFSFFNCNGFNSQHWLCCEEQNNPIQTKSNKLMSRCMIENLILSSSTSSSSTTSSTTSNNRTIFNNCGNYDVYTEINGPRNFVDYRSRTLLEDGTLLSMMDSISNKLRIFFPQHHHLYNIHEQYPNSTFIFNYRPIQSWIDSVLAWDDHDTTSTSSSGLSIQLLNEFYYQNSTRFLFLDNDDDSNNNHNNNHNNSSSNKNKNYKTPPYFNSKNSRNNNNNIRKYLEIIYRYHLQYVQEFVIKYPSHTLIEIDITNKDTGKNLIDALFGGVGVGVGVGVGGGLKEDCWGHFNQNINYDSSNSTSTTNTTKRRRRMNKGNPRKVSQQHLVVASSGNDDETLKNQRNNTTTTTTTKNIKNVNRNKIEHYKQKRKEILDKIAREHAEINIRENLLLQQQQEQQQAAPE
jgi:hypothetical protein